MQGERSIKGLLAFLHIAEHGSINRAAQAMNVSQPSLSRALQQFEAMVGAPVFVREAKGATLNDLGRQLLTHAQVIRAEANNAARTVDLFRKEKRRQLHIGVVTVHPLVQFAEAILAFNRSAHDVFLRMSHGSVEELTALLEEGEIEMIFGPLIEPPPGHTLIQDAIYCDALSLYCGVDAPIAKLSRVTFQDLREASWILPPAGVLARDKVAELFALGGEIMPNIAMEVENVPMRRALVQRSECISSFHAHHVHQEIESGTMLQVNFDWTCDVGPIGTIRLTPHTAVSRHLLHVFQAHYAACGLSVPPRRAAPWQTGFPLRPTGASIRFSDTPMSD